MPQFQQHKLKPYDPPEFVTSVPEILVINEVIQPITTQVLIEMDDIVIQPEGISVTRKGAMMESQQYRCDSWSSETSDDLVVFSVVDRVAQSDTDDVSETASSDNENQISSDEAGWTSDCEQLCAKLFDTASVVKNSATVISMPCSSYNKTSIDVDKNDDSRFTKGVDLSFMTNALRDMEAFDTSSDEEMQPPMKPPLKELPLAYSAPGVKWEETDSGISSGNSNPSDSSTCDEDANLKTCRAYPKETASSLGNNHRKVTRGNSQQWPFISVRHLTISIPSNTESTKSLTLEGSPDVYESLSSQESDWESDTESEDLETHYPSRSSARAKLRAAAAASAASQNGLSPPDSLSPNSQNVSFIIFQDPTQNRCLCRETSSIQKCAFCVDSRKRLQKATHKRTVRFPSTSEKLETMHYLEETEDEDSYLNDLFSQLLSNRNSSPLKGSGFSGSSSNGSVSWYSSSSRKSPWEMMARDRQRFQRRIFLTNNKISCILMPEHRDRIFSARFNQELIVIPQNPVKNEVPI